MPTSVLLSLHRWGATGWQSLSGVGVDPSWTRQDLGGSQYLIPRGRTSRVWKTTRAFLRVCSCHCSAILESRSPTDTDTQYHRDPYLSPTERLFTLIHTQSALPRPPPAYTATGGLDLPTDPPVASSMSETASFTPEADRSATLLAPLNCVAAREGATLPRPLSAHTHKSERHRLSSRKSPIVW